MKNSAQKINATTQKFTEIVDVVDNVVLFSGDNACSIIEIQATNFSLLSAEEQDAKMYAYASLLNSLSFSIQIIIRSRKLDISSYLKSLDDEAEKTQNQMLANQIKLYHDFVQELVKVNIVLDKRFYICIPYSYLEQGAISATTVVAKKHNEKSRFIDEAKTALHAKLETLHAQLARLGLRSKTLTKEELINLYYEIYNETSPETTQLIDNVNTVIIKGRGGIVGLFKKKDKKKPAQTPVNTKTPGLKALQKGMNSLVDIIAPSSIEVDFKHIRIGDVYYRTFFVVGYPRYASPNWLQPLIDFEHSMNVSMFVYPTMADDTLEDLKRKIAEMEASVSFELEQGRNADPKITAALDDALSIQEELAKGTDRFFQFSLYITLFSSSLEDLNDASKMLSTTLGSIMVIAKTATLQMEDGFKSTIPTGQDKLFTTRNMDTTSLVSTFPFTSATLTQDKGVMYGVNQQNSSLVIFDRYSLENANEVVLGKAGAGKSYLVKLEAMRQFMFGTEVIIIDPEGEYGKLATALGGELVTFTPSAPVKINPFDLSGLYEEGENELGLKILSLHGLLKIVMGDLTPTHDAILDRALMETYRQKGITADPSTQKKQPPLMEDLYKVLLGMEDSTSKELALRLEKFVKGSLNGIFNQQSNFDIKNPFTVFDIKSLEEELRPVAMHIILDFIWTKVKKEMKRRLLILDEAWYIMKYPDSASFVYGIAKRSRKYYLALTTATQDVQDFLSTDYGKAVLSNSSLQILLKQSTTEIDLVSKVFYLSQGEKELLLSAAIGEGLFFAGQSHVAMKAIAAPFEHVLITSNPQELEKMKQDEDQKQAEEDKAEIEKNDAVDSI